MNLIHKIGVVFHAQDHLSRHMDQMGKKFALLERHQKAFEQGERTIRRLADQRAMKERRLAEIRQRNSMLDKRAQMERLVLQKQAAAQETALSARRRLEAETHMARMGKLTFAASIEQDVLKRDLMVAEMAMEKARHLKVMHDINAEGSLDGTIRKAKLAELKREQKERARILATQRAQVREARAELAAVRTQNFMLGATNVVRRVGGATVGAPMAMMAAGGRTLASAGLTIGMAGAGAYHLASRAANVDRQKMEVEMALRSEKGAAPRLLSDLNTRGVQMPFGVKMSQHEQLNVMQDIISQGVVKAPAVMGMTAALGPLIRLMELKGAKTEGLAKAFAFTFERAGITDEAQAVKFVNRFAQGQVTAPGRLTGQFMQQFVTKVSPFARAMKLNMLDVPSLEFMATHFTSGSQASTQVAGMLSMLARGGTNDPSRAILATMGKAKLIDVGSAPSRLVIGGKPVLDKRGKQISLPQTLDFHGKSIFQVMDDFKNTMLKVFHIPQQRFMQGKLTVAERGKLNALDQQLFPNQRGALLSLMFLDPLNMTRFKQEQRMTNAAPDLQQQLTNAGNKFGLSTKNVLAELDELGRVFGKELQPHVQGFLTMVEKGAHTLTEWVKHNHTLIQQFIRGAKYTAAFVVGLGAVQVALGAAPMLWAGALLAGFNHTLPTMFNSGGATAVAVGTGLAALLGMSLSSSLAIGAVAVGVGALFADAFGKARAARQAEQLSAITSERARQGAAHARGEFYFPKSDPTVTKRLSSDELLLYQSRLRNLNAEEETYRMQVLHRQTHVPRILAPGARYNPFTGAVMAPTLGPVQRPPSTGDWRALEPYAASAPIVPIKPLTGDRAMVLAQAELQKIAARDDVIRKEYTAKMHTDFNNLRTSIADNTAALSAPAPSYMRLDIRLTGNVTTDATNIMDMVQKSIADAVDKVGRNSTGAQSRTVRPAL